MWSLSSLRPLGGSVRTDKSALGAAHRNYPFTSRDGRTVKTFMKQSPSVIQLVISSASPAAETQSLRETLWSWAISAKGRHQGLLLVQDAAGWMSVSGLNWYQGAGNIHLLKSSHCSAASHCCVIVWSRGREESRVFCRAHSPSSSWFYPPFSENHLCSLLVRLLLFAARLFHYL